MIRELVENYEDNKNIVDNLNIHILPMANPDGYEYSRSSVSSSSSTSSFWVLSDSWKDSLKGEGTSLFRQIVKI